MILWTIIINVNQKKNVALKDKIICLKNISGWLTYWIPSKHINVESTLKQCWSSTFINAVPTLIFVWKWKLSLRTFIDVVYLLKWNNIIYENDMTQFVFIFSKQIKCEEWKECDMKKYLLFCVTFVTVSVNQSKNWLLGRVIGQICLLTTNFHFTFVND